MHSTFTGVPDGPVIALAQLRLARAGVKMACTHRAQAISILRSVRPAIAKTFPLALIIHPAKTDLCRNCSQPIPFGTPCKVCFTGELPEHINCKAKNAELATLYQQALEQINW